MRNKSNSILWQEEVLKRFHNAVEKELRKDDAKNSSIPTLYHYTNLNSMNLILANRNFIFSDFRYLNDTLEFQYGLQLSHTILSEIDIPNKDIFLKTLNSFIENPKNINFYISCFSEVYDNLALWRYYGDDGSGVAIGVDCKFELEQDEVVENPTLGNVTYGEKGFRESLSKLLRRIQRISNCPQYRQLEPHTKHKIELALHGELATFIIFLCVLTKHHSYKDEEEIRLLLIDGAYSKRDSHPKGFFYPEERISLSRADFSHWNINEDLQIFEDKSTIEKRFLRSTQIKQENFTELWIGPKCIPKTKDYISRKLEILGYDLSKIKISQVNLPYR